MMQFDAIPSTVPFITGDAFVNLIMGPVGSTKTAASIIKIVREAKRVHPCRDGVRRSRVAVVRNTKQMLWDTTIPDFLKWFPDGEAGLLEKTQSKFTLRLDDIECEVLFRGLDEASDVRRLLSLQLSFAMMDEFREINPDVYNMLTTRLGRYPDRTMNAVGCAEKLPDGTVKLLKKIWGASNPPDADTFWEDLITNPPGNTVIVVQPSGLSPEADWLHCLDPDYYENMCAGKTEDWIDVYVHARFGRSLAGLPVFRAFNQTIHVAKDVPALQATPLVVGADAGLNPTVVITQQTYDGRVVVHDAVTGVSSGMGALRFAREKLKPLLATKYVNRMATLFIDPTAFNRGPNDERSVADILKNEGLLVKPAKTNAISARISAVDAFLTRTVEGKPALLVSPVCKELVSALRARYRYKINQKGERGDEPEKSHPWSDYADALQYACLQHDGGVATGGHRIMARREVKPAPYRWAA